MSSSDIYAHETELGDWCEMLMRWMSRTYIPEKDESALSFSTTAWLEFAKEYPPTALEMEVWLEARHDDNR